MLFLLLNLMLSMQINQARLQPKENKCLSIVLKYTLTSKLSNEEMMPGMPGYHLITMIQLKVGDIDITLTSREEIFHSKQSKNESPWNSKGTNCFSFHFHSAKFVFHVWDCN